MTRSRACRRTALALTVMLAAGGAGFPTGARAAPDRATSIAALGARLADLRSELHGLREDAEDLREPMADFELFDQCAFAIGVSSHGARGGAAGYLFGDVRRAALALDLGTARAPDFTFLAFPPEEPPSIECNEDADAESVDG